MAGYNMPNFNPEIDAARKRGDRPAWGRLVGDLFAGGSMAHKVDALVEAHFAAETVRNKAFQEFAATQAIAMEQVLKETPSGRATLTALKTPGKSGKSNLQEALDRKALASGAAISPAHAVLAMELRGVIKSTPSLGAPL